MRESFKSNQERVLVDFYGKFPNETSNYSKNFQGGLLNKMLKIFFTADVGLVPILDSYEKWDNNLYFNLIHTPTKTMLSYDSINNFEDYEISPEFYQENLTAKANCSDEEFEDRLEELEFLRTGFGYFKDIFSPEFASEKEISQIKKAVKDYHADEKSRMKL